MADRMIHVYALRYLQNVEQRALRRERVFLDRTNAFEMNDEKFRRNFRFNKECVMWLIRNINLPPPTRKSSLSVEVRVLAALRFYAHGGYQGPVGEEGCIGLSQKSVSKSVISVSRAISDQLMKTWIKFPKKS